MKDKYLNNEKTSRGLRMEAGIVEEAAVEPEEQTAEEAPKKESKVGTVYNCTRLNLRSEPVKDETGANVVRELITGAVVLIDEEASTDDFYKVIAESAVEGYTVEGYCMKQYVRLS